MNQTSLHTPVMQKEVIHYLDPKPGKRFIDATLGYGGHALAILKAGSQVTGIDRDAEMLKLATDRIKQAGYSASFTPIHASFAQALDPAGPGPAGPYDGVLFDLGVSSYQLDTPGRGFSFRFDAPLDMRMDTELAVTAADLINGLGKNELIDLFTTLGEEHNAKRIVSAICKRRLVKKIETTQELADLISSLLGRSRGIHPATKVFQALRMAVNSERDELKAALPSALSHLKPNGVMVTISFHSLEDKIVKTFMQEALANGQIELLTKNVLEPSSEEITQNKRARSAKLRACQRIK